MLTTRASASTCTSLKNDLNININIWFLPVLLDQPTLFSFIWVKVVYVEVPILRCNKQPWQFLDPESQQQNNYNFLNAIIQYEKDKTDKNSKKIILVLKSLCTDLCFLKTG